MTKQEFCELFDSVIDGRTGFSVDSSRGSVIRVYSVDNNFTATFIKRVVGMTGDYFMGITMDSNNKPYLLFSL